MASGSNIGIMDEAYFVGRKEILRWINTTFDLNVGKIEETASGAVACQIADSIFGRVPMSKVKWDAKSDYEFVNNYKVLQRVFQNNKVDKHVEVERLVRAKYQDNLEFMQWMKRFYELNHGGEDYDPVARRARGKGAPGSCNGGAAPAAPVERAPRRGDRRPAPRKAAADAPARTKKAGEPAPRGAGRGPGLGQPGRDRSLAQHKQVEDLTAQVSELKMSVDGLEKERDFYFGKLRDVEILLQGYTGEDKAMVDSIFKILYATEDDFVVIDGEGEGEGEGEAAEDAPAETEE